MGDTESSALRDNRDRIADRLSVYTREEEIYRTLYELRERPEAYASYLSEIEDEARKRALFLSEFMEIPTLFSEELFYQYLGIQRGSNVHVFKHSRYTPLFEHMHTFFEIVYVLRGHCDQTLGGESLPLGEGDLCFVPPGARHTIGVFDDSVILNVQIRKDTFDDFFFNSIRTSNVLSDFFMSSLYSKTPARSIIFPTYGDLEIRDLILDMVREVESEDDYSFRVLDNLVSLLFVRLLRSHGTSAKLDTANISRNNQTALQMLGYINNHYRSVTLDDLAATFHFSAPYCSRLIREETGIGFVAFVRRLRMDFAVSMLLYTTNSVAGISEAVGYENPESFIRAFQKCYGCSPTAYRKQHLPQPSSESPVLS